MPGYKTIIVMPEAASLEKRDILRNLGAELRIVEVKPYKDPGNYQHISRRLAEELQAKGEGSEFGPTSLTTRQIMNFMQKQLLEKFMIN